MAADRKDVDAELARIAAMLQVVPEEADTVRLIFNKYLELGSVQRLAAWLEEQNIRPKPRSLSNGRVLKAERFWTGPLAYMLGNRFYIGEIVYRGEVHKGEHEAIIDRALFEAVQTRMQDQRVVRSINSLSPSAILTGRIFDDAGHPMSPSHTNWSPKAEKTRHGDWTFAPGDRPAQNPGKWPSRGRRAVSVLRRAV